ncbi:hypothetical protein CesoFtcFv8_016253 [Champsocephalus esox]|uniref:Uncharacterized protein n=2 Tax=Champsocephalus TaxID=52236 RepID=A0AAN8DD37_CHAGU|nr:hypothetical protein CesoFtcFv8_016253 [Champsocephalus esox]KAK5918120.1 hypothetical protein CgunFtcFv8_002913 [Champsocephalus gunnari]
MSPAALTLLQMRTVWQTIVGVQLFSCGTLLTSKRRVRPPGRKPRGAQVHASELGWWWVREYWMTQVDLLERWLGDKIIVQSS